MRLISQTISRFACTISLLAVVSGCGEKETLKPVKSTYDISYSGDLLIGEPIQFQSSAPTGKKLLWQFGDGETSTEFAPAHVYLKAKHDGLTIVDDTVTMIVDNDIYHPNMKFFRLKPGVGRLVGTLNWKGGRFAMHGNCCPGLTNHALNDTVFKVYSVDEYSVGVWGVTVPYLADSNYYSNERSVGRYNSACLRYTPDTLFFRQLSGTADGWAEITYYHKY